MSLDKFKDKKASNLINAIEKSKKCDLASFVYSLGIPNVGKKTATDLCKQFKSFENIKKASYDELILVQDIGSIVAESIVEFFKQEKIEKSLNELFELGVTPFYEESEVVENAFTGKTVVATGTLQNYSRTAIKEKLESLGANVAGSVSKKTDYVIAGENAGSKYDKAVQLGVKILTEEEFEELINNM